MHASAGQPKKHAIAHDREAPGASRGKTRSTAYPEEVRHSTQYAKQVYRLADDGYALPGTARTEAMSVAKRLQTDDGQELLVLRCAPGRVPAGARRIYREPDSSQWRVPSGRVFVRFAPGVGAESRRDLLLQAGYRIQSVPVHAPQAAWLEAATGDVAQALAGIVALESLPEVENVEPQWLAERQLK